MWEGGVWAALGRRGVWAALGRAVERVVAVAQRRRQLAQRGGVASHVAGHMACHVACHMASYVSGHVAVRVAMRVVLQVLHRGAAVQHLQLRRHVI